MIEGMKNAIWKFTKIVLANKFLRIGFVITAALLTFAVLGQFWTPYPLSSNFGISQGPTLAHPLGTDEYGEDVLSVMMASTWPTLEVGLLTGALVALLSTLIGMIAGYYASKVVGPVVDVFTILMLTVPGIILVVDIYGYVKAGSITPSLFISYAVTVLGLAITGWAFGAAQIRSQVLSLSRRDYILASKILGEKSWRILATQVLPPILPLAFMQFLYGVLYGVLSLTTIEFWGVLPSNLFNLGTMLNLISTNASYLSNQWWWILGSIFPILILGVGLGFLNIGMDEFTDPRLKKVRPLAQMWEVEIPAGSGVMRIQVPRTPRSSGNKARGKT